MDTHVSHLATLTGLEPATSAVTGRHANQLRYRAMLLFNYRVCRSCDPNGIRTRVAAVKGRSPRPLNDGAETLFRAPKQPTLKHTRGAWKSQNAAGMRDTARERGTLRIPHLGFKL